MLIFHPLSLTIPHIAYACLGGFVVIFGMFSLFIREKLYIGEAIWAFLFGVIIGPYGAGIFDPRGWAGHNEEITNQITLEFTRVVLAIGVFAIGVELPKAYMARHWKSLLFLLAPVMTWGWFVSAGLIYALIPGLNFLSSLAIASCLTPTDPILAAAVVGGKYADKHVPAHIRHLLAAESGCNDGAAFPFLYISLYLILDSTTAGAIGDWFLALWLYQVVLGCVFGSLLGFTFRHLMKFCERNDLIDRQSYVAQYVSLAFLTIGIMTMLGSDDLLAAFSCGAAFAWDGFFNRQTEEAVFSSVIDLLFNVAAFVYVGAWMPFKDFNDPTLTLSVWRLLVIAILVLILKRLPIIIALYKFIPDIKTFREAVFSGHFGPIGIGAIFISTLAAEQLPKPHDPPANQTEFLAASIQPIVCFMVLCSVAIHGLSIPSFSLGRRVHSVSSRTWSRHASVPDWTTQARHVTRGGADIVINRDRDSAMERGESSVTVEEKSPTESKQASITTPSATPPSPQSEDDLQEEERMKSENPPDGTEVVAEWREGRHTIIERRAGPGEEVEVEVIRNNTPSHSFRVHEDSVRQAVGSLVDRLREAPHKVYKEFENAEDAVKRDASYVAEKVQDASGEKKEGGESGQSSNPTDEDDDGWASDQSVEGITKNLEQSDRHSKRQNSSRSNRSYKPSSIAWRKKGRRLSSLNNGSFSSHAQQLMQPQSSSRQSSDAQDIYYEGLGDDDRGRSDTPRPDTPRREDTDQTAPNPAIHRRVGSLKMFDHRSRDVSPSRSVRFIDKEARSGTSTPRTPQNEIYFPGTSLSEPPQGDDNDSIRGRVTFDLPANKP